MSNTSSPTITNQTNPVGSSYTSEKSMILAPREGNPLIQERSFTTLRLTKIENNPSKYRKELFQHESAKDEGNVVQIGIVNEKGEVEFNSQLDTGGANEEFFKKRIEKQIKTQTKDVEKQIKTKINSDNKAINKNQADSAGSDDSKDSPKPKPPANKGIGRSNYGTMFYPSFIEKSDQDKLKITILEFSSRFKGGKTGESSKKDKTFIEKGGLAGVINRRYIKKTYKKENLNLQNTDGSALSLDNRKRLEVNKRLVGHITLPIPDGVSDQNKVNFGGGTLNPIQVGGAELALDFLLRGMGEAGETAGDIFKQTATDKNVQQALAALLTSSGLGIDNDELLARTEGNIVNNNLELLFKGPTLRPFTFQFNLSPRDPVEARQVQKIIRALKQSSSVQKTTGGIFLAAPNTYKLEFKNGRTNKTHEFLPRIKECALLGVNVNYMPENSYMTYSDSSMVAYNVQLSFQELEPIFNDDYEENDREQTGMTSMPGNPNTGGNIGF